VLLDVAPIDPKMTHASWFVPLGLWGTDVLALAGIAVALATVQPWGWVAPRRLLLALTGAGAVLLVLRAVLLLVQDVLLLTGVTTVAAHEATLAHRLARWDLLLWSPYFLVWGILWGATAWSYQRRSCDRHGGMEENSMTAWNSA